MTSLELKLAMAFVLFVLGGALRLAFGGRPQSFRRHRFWPPDRSDLSAGDLPRARAEKRP